MSREIAESFGCRIVRATLMGLLLLLPTSAALAAGGGDNDNENLSVAPRLHFEPIAGLTTIRHLAPSRTAIPLGTVLYIFLDAPEGTQVTFTGATILSRTPDGVSARCSLDSIGPALVSASGELADGTAYVTACRLDVVPIAIRDISVTVATPTVSAFDVDEFASNELTMSYYFGESIARLVETTPVVSEADGDNGGGRRPSATQAARRFHTSISRSIDFHVDVDPRAFGPVMEWRIGELVRTLGTERTVSFESVGEHTVSVGPPKRPIGVVIDTYSVFITSHDSRDDTVLEGELITFEAVTDPVGFEEYITWLSSTKYGTAAPVLGSGPTFTCQFDDTWGVDPEIGDFQWLGVRADNAVFNQDEKCDVTIKQCYDICKHTTFATVKFSANGSPPGGTYFWSFTAGGANAMIVGAANMKDVDVKGTALGAVTIDVTYTVNNKECHDDCTFNVKDCDPCQCYFSVDCTRLGLGDMCNTGDKTTWQDSCRWMEPPPMPKVTEDPITNCDLVPDNGTTDCCSSETDVYGNCDGLCETASMGSACGTESSTELSAAVSLWADAIISVAETGGGLIDQDLTDQASETVTNPLCASILGRNVGDLLLGLAGYHLFEHPDGNHDFEHHVVADLSEKLCLVEGLYLIVDAVVAEIHESGAGDAIIETIPGLCPEVLDLAVPCLGLDTLECIKQRNRNLAILLTTVRVVDP